MLTPELQAEIEQRLGKTITAVAPLSAANKAHIYRLTLKGMGICVAKVAPGGMEVEAFMLDYLRTRSKLPVPGVFYSNDHVIIMEFVESHHVVDDATQLHAAELLAGLHTLTAEDYGFERDTLVGSLPQPNRPNRDWLYFFVEQRLLFMASEALKEGKIDKKMMKQAEKLAAKLSSYIAAPNPPSLIHGDVWGGNVLAARGRVVAFLDPAIYFADREMELAFIRLLGTFNAAFFSRYQEIHPIAPGFFEERADIYSLYPLLVHARLFGVSYARKAARILDKFV